MAEANLTLQREIVINVQADEPLVNKEHIDALVDGITGEETDISTIATPFEVNKNFHDPNQVKVVLDQAGFALYFSRSPIPYERDMVGQVNRSCLKHIGMYAYTKEFLLEFSALPVGVLEKLEKLEQLRALENGRRIAVRLVKSGTIGVDTPEDLVQFNIA